MASRLFPFNHYRVHPRLCSLQMSFICLIMEFIFWEYSKSYSQCIIYSSSFFVFHIVVQLLINKNMKCKHSLLAFPSSKWRLPLQTFFSFYWVWAHCWSHFSSAYFHSILDSVLYCSDFFEVSWAHHFLSCMAPYPSFIWSFTWYQLWLHNSLLIYCVGVLFFGCLSPGSLNSLCHHASFHSVTAEWIDGYYCDRKPDGWKKPFFNLAFLWLWKSML